LLFDRAVVFALPVLVQPLSVAEAFSAGALVATMHRLLVAGHREVALAGVGAVPDPTPSRAPVPGHMPRQPPRR